MNPPTTTTMSGAVLDFVTSRTPTPYQNSTADAWEAQRHGTSSSPQQYNFSTYANKLAVGNNTAYGWENGYPMVTAMHPLTPWVPAYLDTVDKIIAQKAEQEAYARYMTEATNHAKKISPRKVYTVQELVTLLAWIPDDFRVTGVRATPPK